MLMRAVLKRFKSARQSIGRARPPMSMMKPKPMPMQRTAEEERDAATSGPSPVERISWRPVAIN